MRSFRVGMGLLGVVALAVGCAPQGAPTLPGADPGVSADARTADLHVLQRGERVDRGDRGDRGEDYGDRNRRRERPGEGGGPGRPDIGRPGGGGGEVGGPGRPGIGRPGGGISRPGGRRGRPGWWGGRRWLGRGLRPSWWGTVPYVANSYILIGGYYYPYFLVGGYYYPDYTTPYVVVNGVYVPSYDAPEPSEGLAGQIPVGEAQIVQAPAAQETEPVGPPEERERGE